MTRTMARMQKISPKSRKRGVGNISLYDSESNWSTLIEAADMERLTGKILVDTYSKRSHTLIEKVLPFIWNPRFSLIWIYIGTRIGTIDRRIRSFVYRKVVVFSICEFILAERCRQTGDRWLEEASYFCIWYSQEGRPNFCHAHPWYN